MTSGRSGRWSDASGSLRRGDRPDEAAQVDRLDGDLLGAGVEARDLHEVVDQRPQPPDVGHQQLARPAALDRQVVEVLAQDRRLGDERRQRRPQLVGDVGDEAPVAGLGGLEAADRVGQGGGHPVEALGPGPELVVRGDRHPGRQVAALDPLRGTAGRLDRGQDAAGDDPRHEQGERGSRTIVPTMSASPQLGERLLERPHVVDEVVGRPGCRRRDRRRPGSDDPASVDPGVGELAPIDARAEVRRERRQDVGEVLARDDGRHRARR